MSDLRRWIRELHRRSLWQVLLIYLTASWVVYQVALDLAEGLGLPDWVAPTVLILLMVGLPVVLATAFIQEGAPGQSQDGHGPEPIATGPAPSPLRSAPRTPETAAGDPEAAARPPGPPGFAEESAVSAAPPARSPMADSSPSLGRYLTWRNAVLAGIGAFALLGLVVALFMGSRVLGIGPAATLMAQGALEADARILLADVGAAPGDSAIAEMITEALRVDLEQSEVVRLAEPRVLREALRRMQRDSSAGLSEAIALELAVREGIPAVLVTEMHRAGGAIVLSSRLVAPASEGALASFRQTARDSTDIVDAVDRLSADIRAKIGESLGSIRQSPPLERVTTSSLDALRRYSTAVRVMREEPESREAVALLEEAVATDSTFAMAWLQLGRLYGFLGDQAAEERERAAIRLARQHADRLSARERLLAEAWYQDRVVDDQNARRVALQRLIAEHPDDIEGLHEWADYLAEAKRYREAREALGRLLDVDSSSALAADGEWMLEAFLGNEEAAIEALDRYQSRFPSDSLYVLNQRAFLAAAGGDYPVADSVWQRLSVRPDDNYASGALFSRAFLERGFGRLRSYGDLRSESSRRFGMPQDQVEFDRMLSELSARAWLELPVDAELAGVRRALADGALDRMPPDTRFHLLTAAVLAIAGAPAEGRDALETWLASANEVEERRARVDIANARGEIALAEDRLAEALAAFREVREAAICPECGLVDIGRVHDAAARPDSAIAAWELYFRTPNPFRLRGDGQARAPILERLSELYEQKGAVEEARAALAEFIELWQDADPELQPRVQAARRRLQRLVDREAG